MMSGQQKTSWSSWRERSERERKVSVLQEDFWSELTPKQQEVFFAEAEWQEIRACPEAKQAYLDRLISFEEVEHRLGLSAVQMAFLMSTRQMPAALVGGCWKHDWAKVEAWVEKMGGLDAVKNDVEQQIRKHQRGQEG
jgi:hypothetical protein